MFGTGEQKMENLNAENIINEIQSLIKALKDCGGWVKRGNGEGWFNHEILADALALITSQEQRIGELTEENARLRNRITCQVVLPDEKLEEIKNECLERVELDIKKIEADTVRKMHERLKAKAEPMPMYSHLKIVYTSDIDQISKELERCRRVRKARNT